jgi:phosphoglycerate dehydrogenase-like enzyme
MAVALKESQESLKFSLRFSQHVGEDFPPLLEDRIILSTTALSQGARSKILSSDSTYKIVETTEKRQELPNEISSEVEVLLLSSSKWFDGAADDIRSMKKLRLIQTMTAGVDSVPFELIPEQVQVCGNVGAYAEEVAEHAVSLILSLAKNLVLRYGELRQGIFDQRPTNVFLKGKELGVVGAGRIGQEIARIGKSFGMTTFGINSTGRLVDFFDRIGNMDALNDLLSHSDVVVLALPLTVKTLNLINESNIVLTKEDCIFINVGRGPVVNEKALFDHLSSHQSFKAGVDVWWRYPTSKGSRFAQDFPFFDLPNFLGSPHNADAIPESHEHAIRNAVDNIMRYTKREPLTGLAKREDYLGLKSKLAAIG